MTELLLRRRIKGKPEEDKRPNSVRHYGFWGKVVAHYKATHQARKIIKGLNEARQIQSGTKKATTFDNFLNEL